MNIIDRAMLIAKDEATLAESFLELIERDEYATFTGTEVATILAGLITASVAQAVDARVEQLESGGRVHTVNMVDSMDVVGVTS